MSSFREFVVSGMCSASAWNFAGPCSVLMSSLCPGALLGFLGLCCGHLFSQFPSALALQAGCFGGSREWCSVLCEVHHKVLGYVLARSLVKCLRSYTSSAAWQLDPFWLERICFE